MDKIQEKYCPRCETIKPLSEFHKNKRTRLGVKCYCKDCRSKLAAEAYPKYAERMTRWPKNNPEKFKATQKRYAQSEKGKKAIKRNQQKFVKTKKGKRRNRKAWLKAAYKMTLEQYDEMFEAQNGVCAICGRPETATLNGIAKRLAVDHNHETGEIRGLLCHKCNGTLGYVDESIDILLSIIIYLGTA